MQADDPPYLNVGTAVSAKYKGAFCEAKVSKVVIIVKCKVTFKMGLGTTTVSNEQIKGTLRAGHTVQAKHPDTKEFAEATIMKIQDCSQYTVVFDDGDITTLRRSALCLKSGRHFNESETLDQLPLTHPEHFGNPVVGGRRGRRSRQLRDDSSEGEGEEENEPDLEDYSNDIGRVVSVEATDKKRSKDNWFPGLVVIPSAQPTVRINVKDEFLIRSFKDGRYYTVPKKEVTEFNRTLGDKVESPVLAEAVSKALKYLDQNELPVHWERNILFNMQSVDSDSEDNYSDSSDDEPTEEKDRFVAQLFKFMDDAGTPLNKTPEIANKDVDLHRLYRVVHKFGGYNRVTSKSKWRTVANRLKLPNNQAIYTQVKNVYRKCLLNFDPFYKTLGVTMLNLTRSTKKNRGRNLIRDRDRATPINSPKPDKDEEEKVNEEKVNLEEKFKKRLDAKKEEERRRKENIESSDSNSGESTDQSESAPGPSVGRPRRIDKLKKIKSLVELDTKSKTEITKKEEEDRAQQTRSKSQIPKPKEMVMTDKKKEVKSGDSKAIHAKIPKKSDEEKKRGRKKLNSEDKPSVEIISDTSGPIGIGDKLKVYYGPTHESKVTYEAKVIEIDKDPAGPLYLVHYTGWNTRYDEWITPNRIAENLSANTKAKKLKQGANVSTSKQNTTGKSAPPRKCRRMSITGRSTEVPRSTTPSSVTSSSSRTKSPATPATRSTSRMTRQDHNKRARRASAQTDVSNHSESDSDISESESELTRTRSGSKLDEIPEIRTYKKKPPKPLKLDKTKDEGDTEKEEEPDRPRRTRKMKKLSEKSADESDDDNGTNPPKGRDFDLNQIRSELKGFSKAIKVPSVDAADKEELSCSDDSSNATKIDAEEKKDVCSEKSPSSEDIYEFKEPEPFEFEARPSKSDDKVAKKRIPRLFDELEKSPKRRAIKSPEKCDKDSPDSEKRKIRRPPLQEEDIKKEDPFDKLVESPSFNLVKSVDKTEAKQRAIKNILEEPLSLFRELPESVDDYSQDMDLSDTESQTQPIFSRRAELFSDAFSKSSPDGNALDLDFSTKGDDLKNSDDFDSIRESINRVIERTPSSDGRDDMSDEDDLMITPSTSSYQGKKKEADSGEVCKSEPVETKSEIKEELTLKSPMQISPALQETDSSLLESICSQPVSISAKLEEAKGINLKTGTKMADSILRKFSSIKNKTDKSHDSENECEAQKEVPKPVIDDKKVIEKIKPMELKLKPADVEVKKPMTPTKVEMESRKKRKIISKAYIEESDSDSSDSEQLVIARMDDDSQTNSEKTDLKESDSNLSTVQIATTDDSQEEHRNFKIDKNDGGTVAKTAPEPECAKEEEPDSQLHYLLLCEEIIPRSPASATEGPSVSEPKPKGKTVQEMPFASAPGNSNNKNMLLNEHKPIIKPQLPPLVIPMREDREAPTVLENTPPTTPESSMSNSPRGDQEDLSPNTVENESCKSNDAEPDYPRKRRNSSLNKVPLYSEDDSQMTNEPTSTKKSKDETVAATCKKRRRSTRGNDDAGPAKRGRKPLNRSRQNSDSDDMSENSTTGAAANLPVYDRTSKSPRPSKYNFFVEFDPSLNSGQRIAVLQQKLTDLRKTYAEVKSELAAVEKRRKKIRRREREALKATKQELVCG